ncbi:MAG: hypothetical protein HY515_01780 [Candidatus Aenigmarchaeota archaeon]|nr:hypothetical protein [Candidatus Aenigmarchaeota archaeon]
MTLETLIDTFALKYADIAGYASGAYFALALALKLESHVGGPAITYREALQTARDILVLDPTKEYFRQRAHY